MRTVIIYPEKGEKIVLTGAAAKRASVRGREKGEDRDEKVAFHNRILSGCREAELDGKMPCTRREADFYKRVHTAAAECGGDLPAVGTTRLEF